MNQCTEGHMWTKIHYELVKLGLLSLSSLNLSTQFQDSVISCPGSNSKAPYRLGGSLITEIYFLQFWRLQIQDWGASTSSSGEGLLLGLHCQRLVSSRGGEERGEAGSLVTHIRTSVPFVRASLRLSTSSTCKYLPKAPPPNLPLWGIGVQYINLGKIQTFSPRQAGSRN